MAVCNRILQAPPLSRYLPPIFSCRAMNLSGGYRRLKATTVMFSSAVSRTGHLRSPVRAEVKRVSRKDDIVALERMVGLTAPQVGLNVQLMVFNPAGEPGEGK